MISISFFSCVSGACSANINYPLSFTSKASNPPPPLHRPSTCRAFIMPPTNSTPPIVIATANNPETTAAASRSRDLTRAIHQIQLAREIEKGIKERVEALSEFCNHPPIVHQSSLGPDANDWECLICRYSYWRSRALQDELPEAAEFPVRLPCGHVYGVICISKWLLYKKTCPMCKAEMERTVDLKIQVIDRLDQREVIDGMVEILWGMSCGWGTMQKPTSIDEIRYVANLASTIDPSGIVERFLEETGRRIRVMEELVSNNESMLPAELFSGFLRLSAPTDKVTMAVLLETLRCEPFHPGAVRLFARPRVAKRAWEG